MMIDHIDDKAFMCKSIGDVKRKKSNGTLVTSPLCRAFDYSCQTPVQSHKSTMQMYP